MNKHGFKFLVQKPKNQIHRPLKTQTVAIITQSPYFYAMYELERNLGDPEKLRLLQAEIKLEMIKSLLEGEWEFDLE